MGSDHISAFTNCVNADNHKHYMIQLFISFEKPLRLEVEGEPIEGYGVLVNQDVEHCFYAEGERHLTMLIDVTSDMGSYLSEVYLKNKAYTKMKDSLVSPIQQLADKYMENMNVETYEIFIKDFKRKIGLEEKRNKERDERIATLLATLETCTCQEHTLEHFAKTVHLSKSRLAHLFKEQTGIPLKSYIVLHKIQKAYKGLLGGEDITKACLEAGFDSPSHFAYTSKVLTGMKATDIRKDSVFLKVSPL